MVLAGDASNRSRDSAEADNEGKLLVLGREGKGRAGGKEGSRGNRAARGADNRGREGGSILLVAGLVQGDSIYNRVRSAL